MYLIQCPAGHSFPVPAKAAGTVASCPTCGAEQKVPKLGELRNYPPAEPMSTTGQRRSVGMGGKIVFAIFMFCGVASGLSAAFGAFRWQNMPVPYTEEQHVADQKNAIANLTPIELVATWEQIEAFGLGPQRPFDYQRMQNIRDHWRRVCLISLGITAVCFTLAIASLAASRLSHAGADT